MSEKLTRIQILENDNSALKKANVDLRQLNAQAVEAANVSNTKWGKKFTELQSQINDRIEEGKRLKKIGEDLQAIHLNVNKTDVEKMTKILYSQMEKSFNDLISTQDAKITELKENTKSLTNTIAQITAFNEQIKNENDGLKLACHKRQKIIQGLYSDNESLKSQLKTCESALKVYADKTSWTNKSVNDYDRVFGSPNQDGSLFAINALSHLDKLKGETKDESRK